MAIGHDVGLGTTPDHRSTWRQVGQPNSPIECGFKKQSVAFDELKLPRQARNRYRGMLLSHWNVASFDIARSAVCRRVVEHGLEHLSAVMYERVRCVPEPNVSFVLNNCLPEPDEPMLDHRLLVEQTKNFQEVFTNFGCGDLLAYIQDHCCCHLSY